MPRHFPEPVFPPGGALGEAPGPGAPPGQRPFSTPQPGSASPGRPRTQPIQAPGPISAPAAVTALTDPRKVLENYGAWPGATDPNAPRPDLQPGRMEFNPISGTWVMPDGTTAVAGEIEPMGGF